MRPVGSKYLLEEPLGRGATGTVWRAQVRDDASLRVAIKVLREELATDPDVVMRFLRERSALLRLIHPNIVRVRDLVVEGEVLALVMDLVEGPDLFRYLRENGPFSPIGTALLMAQVADALAASHADGVVHRDLKPANVLLATEAGPEGPVMRPLLTDFGIARLADSPGLTRTHEFVGTPAYVAPESAEGREQTSAVDVYGAGIMLYELATGRPPFQGDSPLQMLQAHLTQEPERPRTLPEPLWTVIERCLRKRAAERPTAAALAGALRTVAAGIGVHATVAQIEAADAVAALLTPPAPFPQPGGPGTDPSAVTATGPFGAPGQDLPTRPIGRVSAAPGSSVPGSSASAPPVAAPAVVLPPPGAADPTQVLPSGPGGAPDPTRVMPPTGQPPYGQAPYGQSPYGGQQPPYGHAPFDPNAGGPAEPGPHPWQTQLSAARARNEQTQVGWYEEYAEPEVAPPPYRQQPGQQQPGQQPYQQQPGHAPGSPAAPGANRPQGYAQPQQGQRPQVAPRPYRPAPAEAAAAAPAPAYDPPVPAEPARPSRPARPAPAREPEPERYEEREPREPRPRRPRRRMRVPWFPGKGCLKMLLILAVIAFLVWEFSPLHGWIDHAVDTVRSWWDTIGHDMAKIKKIGG